MYLLSQYILSIKQFRLSSKNNFVKNKLLIDLRFWLINQNSSMNEDLNQRNIMDYNNLQTGKSDRQFKLNL